MKWLGRSNWYVFQWLGFRLTANVDETENNKVLGWLLMLGIKPWSGWDGRPYKYFFNRKKPIYVPLFGKTGII